MSSKKYTDFPSGTYDTSKIFLQADATTGALEKVNLPGTDTFNVFNTPANNTSPGPTTVFDYTLPANKVTTNGSIILVKTFIITGGSGTSKTMEFAIGASASFNFTQSFALSNFIVTTIIRTGTNTINYSFDIIQGTNTTRGITIGATLDFTIANHLLWKLTAGTSNIITAKSQTLQIISV